MHLVLGTTYSIPILHSELDTACCENELSVEPVTKELILLLLQQ